MEEAEMKEWVKSETQKKLMAVSTLIILSTSVLHNINIR